MLIKRLQAISIEISAHILRRFDLIVERHDLYVEFNNFDKIIKSIIINTM